jgi:DNA-3-methyladenine glycosylase II
MSTRELGARASLAFSLEPVPPFRLDLTVWTLRRRPDNAVDLWDGRTYRRVLVLDGEPVEVVVSQAGTAEAPRLQVVAGAARQEREIEREATAALDRALGLRVDLSEFYRFARSQPHLGLLVERFLGLKPPRFPGVSEALVNGIACQQFTLTQGIRLLSRLTEAYGLSLPGDASRHAFPRLEDLAIVEPEALRPLGFSGQKARAIVGAAQATVEGRLDLEGLAELDEQAAVARLRELRGVGRWTAEYVLLRGLGRTDVFPGDDVGARNNLRRYLGLAEPLDYAGVQRTLSAWRPFGGLLYFHLLLDSLAERGYIR